MHAQELQHETKVFPGRVVCSWQLSHVLLSALAMTRFFILETHMGI